MSYIAKGRRYTYGVKSTIAQVSVISNPLEGETVFCLENSRLLTYDGTLWMCNDFIKLINGSGVTLSEGAVVIASTSTAGTVTRTTTQGDPLVIGPVVFGSIAGGSVAVAISGIYNVNTNGSTNAGDFALTSTSLGLGDSTTTLGDGFFGIYVEQKLSASLTRCLIRSKAEYF